MRKSWSEQEDLYLKNNYGNNAKDLLIKNLNKSWSSIQSRAFKLKIKRNNIEIKGKNISIWSEKEIKLLKEIYPSEDKHKISKVLNRSWSAIQNKAFILKLKREIFNANSNKLINLTNESFYWLGFIMADGHFNKNNQIQINLALKDINHLNKFAKFVEYKKEIIKPSISISYKNIKYKLNELFNISSIKTYEPCNLNKLTGDIFFSFIIGFIDGDGTINKKGCLCITSHKSWLNNVDKMLYELTDNKRYNCKISNDGLVKGIITNVKTMKQIKQKALELNLPILKRKWDRIDLNKLSKQEKNTIIKNKCNILFEKGISLNEIKNLACVSKSTVYKMYSEYNKRAIKERDFRKENNNTL